MEPSPLKKESERVKLKWIQVLLKKIENYKENVKRRTPQSAVWNGSIGNFKETLFILGNASWVMKKKEEAIHSIPFGCQTSGGIQSRVPSSVQIN
ncbi:hypothetical protein BpHYR1_054607 [Brachionus plicatilis]|uniref:Uncharacterized protein n=1 Tax=Brachionus plicatilis TaxID=10195 RepID=A0A3M7RFD7_BRAPC|nr:hypothetical protein BpHYR1_054607 [Brachionus plicatilis]